MPLTTYTRARPFARVKKDPQAVLVMTHIEDIEVHRTNPGMEELLAIIDETEGLVRTGVGLGGC